MKWETPNVAWNPADVLATTDFNRIEGNPLYLRNNKFEVVGCLGYEFADITLTPTMVPATVTMQKVGFRLLDGEQLVLRRARYCVDSADLGIVVQVDLAPGTVLDWESNPAHADAYAGANDIVDIDDVLATNVSGGPLIGFIEVILKNATAHPRIAKPYTGWSLTFEIEDV